jgi:hypothetical protein
MSAAYLQARTWGRPFVKVSADWSACSADPERVLRIFTNCEEVVIACNGNERCRLPGQLFLEAPVAFEPGTLTVEGVRQGETTTDRLCSWGAPSALALSPEIPAGPVPLPATVGVLVSVRDDRERPVLDWKGDVTVTLRGPARVRFHTPLPMVPVAGGVGRFFVTGTGEPGQAVLSASHEGLGAGKTAVRFEEQEAGAITEL